MKQASAAVNDAAAANNVELDQILDLGSMTETTAAAAVGAAAAAGAEPIIAFEENSITSPKPEPPVAGN